MKHLASEARWNTSMGIGENVELMGTILKLIAVGKDVSSLNFKSINFIAPFCVAAHTACLGRHEFTYAHNLEDILDAYLEEN